MPVFRGDLAINCHNHLRDRHEGSRHEVVRLGTLVGRSLVRTSEDFEKSSGKPYLIVPLSWLGHHPYRVLPRTQPSNSNFQPEVLGAKIAYHSKNWALVSVRIFVKRFLHRSGKSKNTNKNSSVISFCVKFLLQCLFRNSFIWFVHCILFQNFKHLFLFFETQYCTVMTIVNVLAYNILPRLYIQVLFFILKTSNSKLEVKLKVGDNEVEGLESFIYLGSNVTKGRSRSSWCEEKIALACGQMKPFSKFWIESNISRKTKATFFKSVVLSVCSKNARHGSWLKERKELVIFYRWNVYLQEKMTTADLQ